MSENTSYLRMYRFPSFSRHSRIVVLTLMLLNRIVNPSTCVPLKTRVPLLSLLINRPRRLSGNSQTPMKKTSDCLQVVLGFNIVDTYQSIVTSNSNIW